MAAMVPQFLFGTGRTNDEAEQLLKLFWSRASLKKQFDKLRNENLALSEQLKDTEMLKLRLQQRVEQLESMLANPATSSAAITYYQLKSLWHICSMRLAAVSAELWQQHYDVEHRRHIGKFRREMYKSLSAVQRQLQDVSRQGETLSEQILAHRELRNRCQGFWSYFRRRRLTAEINQMRIGRRAITMRLGELTEEIQSCSNAHPPQFGGLETATKRSVNFIVIAFAQELYLHFAGRELAARAREAAIMQVTDVNFGDRRACREISRHIESRVALLQNDATLDSRARQRAAYLAEFAVFNRDNDSLPVAASLSSIPLLTAEGKLCGQVDVNVLAEEYWDLPAAVLT